NFRKVTELASWNADAWVYLSSVFLDKNNFTEVSHVLEAAVKVVPDDFRVNFLLGVSYNRLGQNEQAARVLEHARQLNSKDVDAISQLAVVYEALKRFDETDSLYEEALRLDPANHLVLNNYSYSLAERDIQLDRARDMAEKAVAAKPDNASYLDTMGWIYFRLGEYKEAAEYVRRAIEKGEVSAVVYEHLGDIYYKMDNKTGALEQWNIALQLDENNRELRDKILRGSL
ncbi:tetratricopeptide repeat protein, partial [bacterium]